jgi:hypothetical protein
MCKQKRKLKLRTIFWSSFASVLIGAVLFSVTDEPFAPSFKAGLVLIFGGLLALGLGLGFAGVVAKARWKKALGALDMFVCAAVAFTLLLLVSHPRLVFFRPISPAEWKEDLRFLSDTITHHHKDALP